MIPAADAGKTLDELEGIAWGEPSGEFVSHLIERCYALRQIPIADLTPADLRVLIGQSIGLKYLVPRALEILEREPLLDAEFYPGDLLGAVLKIEGEFWSEHPEWETLGRRIFIRAEALSVSGSIQPDAQDIFQGLRARWTVGELR